MKKYLVFLLAALTYSTCIKAQGVTGKVMESDTVPVPYAAVSLLQASDSTYIIGAIITSHRQHGYYVAAFGAKLGRSNGNGCTTSFQDGARSVCLSYSRDSFQ